METTTDLGTRLRQIRKASGESLAETAKSIKTDRAYLNKIELGSVNPSERLLDKIIEHFGVEGNSATMLKQLAGHAPLNIAMVDGREVKSMAKTPVPLNTPQNTQVAINPAQTPVLYTDSVFVSSSEYGMVLDVAQVFGGGLQQNVVARIGMSYDHAKMLATKILDQIEKNER